MISINETLIIQLISFMFLVFVLNRLMFRPIIRIMDERAKHIEDEKRHLDNIEDEARELADKCVSMEIEARKSALNESSQIKKEAAEIAEKILFDTREETNNIKKAANQEIDKKINEAKKSLQQEAMILSDQITEKVIGRRIVN